MKTKTQKVLPKTASEITNGGVYIQRVQCGKSNCKCARGESHTAFYFFTRRGGKLIKFYIRRAEVEAFSLKVEREAIERRHKQQAVKVSADLLSKFRADLSRNVELIKNLRGSQDHE